MAEPQVTVNVELVATVGENSLTIRDSGVTLSKPGSRGGLGPSLTVSWAQWEAIVATVERCHAGIQAVPRRLITEKAASGGGA